MFLFFFFCFFVTSATSEETYQNSSNICQKCACQESADAQIFTLDCSNQHFTQMLANWPSGKPTIKAIFTNNNFATLEKLPPTDSSVEVLLSNCQIQFLDAGVFDAALRTKFVDLSHNFLTSAEVTSDKFRGPFVGEHAQPTGVEHLNLGYNQIHSLNKNVFEFLPNLTWLNLEGNDFTVLDVHTQLALGKVSGLTSLNLANNELTELVEGAIEHFTKLVELDLSKNDLDFVPHSLRTVGQSLEVLILDDNPIIEMTAEPFADLVNLIKISANNLTTLKHISAGTFASTLKLTKVSLCNSSLQSMEAGAFASNSSLKELNLSHNNLTAIPLSLLHWSQLEVLDIRNNPLTCTCDLYYIASALSSEITRNKNGPSCADASHLVQVYSLTSDICSAKVTRLSYKKIYPHSAPLIGLFVAMVLALSVAMVLGYSRYRRFVRARNDQFVSQVIYSPLLNTYSRA